MILFPDLKAFDLWSEKAIEIQKQCNCQVRVSKLLENIASDDERSKGEDIADFLIRQHQNPIDHQN